jgi:hypothetical protein
MFLHIISASYVDNYKIALKFNNGSEGIADLSESLTGKVFEPLQELLLFQQFELEQELGTVCWQNGVDFAPEYLYFLAFRNVPELQTQFQEWGYLTKKVAVSI